MSTDQTIYKNKPLVASDPDRAVVAMLVQKIRTGQKLTSDEEVLRERFMGEVEQELRRLAVTETLPKMPATISSTAETAASIGQATPDHRAIFSSLAAAELQIAAGATSISVDNIPLDIFGSYLKQVAPAAGLDAQGTVAKQSTKAASEVTQEAQTEAAPKEAYSIKKALPSSEEGDLLVKTGVPQSKVDSLEVQASATMPSKKLGDTLHSFLARELNLPTLVPDIGAQYSLLETLLTDARQQTNTVGTFTLHFDTLAVGATTDISYFNQALRDKRVNGLSLIEHVSALPKSVLLRVIENMPKAVRESLLICNSLATLAMNPKSTTPALASTTLGIPKTVATVEISQDQLLSYVATALQQHELTHKDLRSYAAEDTRNFMKVALDSSASDLARRVSIFVFELTSKADLSLTDKETVLQTVSRAASLILSEQD